MATQAESEAASWETSIDRFYPQHAATWSDPEIQYRALTSEWNFLPALRFVDWDTLIQSGGVRVLDLGAGTGWLSAYLSRFDEVAHIDAVDSSRRNLIDMLPSVVERLGGVMSKIRPVRALFTPILVDDMTYDLIVASSALHHAPKLAEVLQECHRVLTPDGAVAVLNETPLSTLACLYRMGRVGASAAAAVLGGRYEAYSPTVSAGGLLYDPFLGDVAYSMRQWEAAFSQSGWSYETIRTPLGSYKKGPRRQVPLTHFLLRKAGVQLSSYRAL
jgi:SAM-dependent methyltransferase